MFRHAILGRGGEEVKMGRYFIDDLRWFSLGAAWSFFLETKLDGRVGGGLVYAMGSAFNGLQ